MPPDRNRTSNSQGRQKSCSECAKAKRRCDLRQPSCLRCTRQDLTCLYPPAPATTGTPSSHSASMTLESVADDDNLFSFDAPSYPNGHDVELLDFDFCGGLGSIYSFDDQLNGDVGGSLSLSRLNYLPGKLFSASHITPYAQSRVEYSIEQLKAAPAMMVFKNQTPWCHPNLYEDYMPRSLQDAHAACALYSSRNNANATFVARHITDHLKELLDSPVPTNSTELLARAQALVLYQIMLVFSGDIRYYGQVNALIRQLEDIGTRLQTVVMEETDPSDPLPLYPTIDARAAWKSFIFREAARRSLLILFHFLAMCNLMRGHLSSCSSHLATGNRVTLSAHLWSAASAFDFAVAWNEKKHHLVKELNFADVLETARADDIDIFGRMIMTGLMGIDDVKGWFHTRGGTY
ncbi:hypothetical protein K505DRAFT_57899 [Melanomma pulvis-pyrius CBS 109.77]|uniref:Zn(2)-C6 fungal-type domain-containing protein n=1 Tax=Melanomma pulvis-pyrius CBS 109.77 TaxID=1314802 RepID=A0A6A6XUW0_9PLEO|nr:hypothetical protein K505DRAFT_57899 [Melanomma pulvis-pyrius CBS 109.77]